MRQGYHRAALIGDPTGRQATLPRAYALTRALAPRSRATARAIDMRAPPSVASSRGGAQRVRPGGSMSLEARQRWFARMMESGLEQKIFAPSDVLTHATPDVLATNLPPELLSKVLSASLAA